MDPTVSFVEVARLSAEHPHGDKPIPLLKTTGRRRLIPNLEQVTCREPTVTPIKLGDLLSALSSLNEVPDLLESLRRKLYLSSTNWRLGAGSELSLRCEYRCEPAALMVTTCPVPGPVLRSSGRRSIREPCVVHPNSRLRIIRTRAIVKLTQAH